MKFSRIISLILLFYLVPNLGYTKNPSDLINDIVDEASKVLSSDDPVESKIIKLNEIAERSVDIEGIGMLSLIHI